MKIGRSVGIFTRKPERDGRDALKAAPYNEPRPITAAATRVNLADKSQVEAIRNRRASDNWQDAAWEYYDLIGEVGFSARLIGSVTSRVRLFPAYIADEENEPIHIRSVEGLDDDVKKAAADCLRLLGSGSGGISGLLRDAAMNLFITGECYLVKQPGDVLTRTPENWQIRSVDEIVTTPGKNASAFIKPRKSAKQEEYIPLAGDAFVGRIWRMHPRYSDEADSSLKSLLDLMDELLLLNKISRKNLKSRLNAGILYIPDEISNISQSDGDIDDNTDTYAELSDDNSASFEDELLDAMTTPISDESSASSIVPLIVRGPAELADKVRHIVLEQQSDPQHIERGQVVMDRILAGLDIPKDVVAGIGDSKYANAVVVEESLYKSHIEPLVLLIVDCLSVVFLRPVLKAMGHDEDIVNNIVIWYDPSPITTKPSKADAANYGYDNGTLSGAAWRRENGFSESDAPTDIETGSRLAVERGLLSEPVTEALLRNLIPEVMAKVRKEGIDMSPSGSTLDAVISNGTEAREETERDTGATPPSELLEP